MDGDCRDAMIKAMEALGVAQTIAHKHETHEAVCARRYVEWTSSTEKLERGIGRLYGMLWTAAGTSILTLITALGVVIFFLLTRHGP